MTSSIEVFETLIIKKFSQSNLKMKTEAMAPPFSFLNNYLNFSLSFVEGLIFLRPKNKQLVHHHFGNVTFITFFVCIVTGN